ncbi:MAG: hypothetical protein M5U01_04655 [Ardenticatenaceae bacterium]|nr:hypothetical protein [Ardenticatenaceae bacterium]
MLTDEARLRHLAIGFPPWIALADICPNTSCANSPLPDFTAGSAHYMPPSPGPTLDRGGA